MVSDVQLTEPSSLPGQALCLDQNAVAAAPERRLRVAILDDDPSVRTAIGRLIGIWQMTVGSFSNCMELFNELPLFKPDCILLDLCMPGLDGLEVLSYLKRNGVAAPVIMITAQDDPALPEACLTAGAAGFLRKPLQAAELLATITEVTSSAR